MHVATRRQGIAEIGLRFMNLRFDDGWHLCRRRWLVSVFRERFTRQNDVVVSRAWRRSSRRTEARAFRPTMFARLETAPLLWALRIIAPTGIVGALIALRRCVFGGREIASALRASSTAASPAPAKAPAAAIAATVATEVLSAAIIAVIAARTRVFLGGVVLAKILRGGGVGLGLTLLRFALGSTITVQLRYRLSFVATGALVMMLVSEIRVQRLFVRDRLLCGIISA